MKVITPVSETNWPLIYVVDDDVDARENLRDILELQHYRMFDAGAALELVALPGWDEVSVILLDRQLPDSSPQELLPEIKTRAPQAGVIIVTGHGDIEGAVTCLRAGARDYILKPINADALIASVSRELDRQRTAASLASSEKRYSALFTSAIDGYLILNSEWQIVEANPAASHMLGCDGREIVGRHLNDFFDESSREPQLPETCSAQDQISGECRLIRKNGIPIDAEFRLVTNFTPGLQLFSFSDVTVRKKAEERARQSERLAAIGETMAALTHESRNALQRSSASLELLELELEDRPEALQLVDRTKMALEQLRQLYEEVRQWAAPLKLSRDECNLKGVWREAWGQIAQVHPAKREALCEQIDHEPKCRIDALLMHHVFRNIFENAIEVTPQGGSVLVLSSQASNNGRTMLRIAIRDDGPGLTPEQQARIFEPFFTTKKKGTGLGMALCQRIVLAHDGAIAATSPGGAEIEITLPMTGQ
jgi:PAS domain S-box-containing protein